MLDRQGSVRTFFRDGSTGGHHFLFTSFLSNWLSTEWVPFLMLSICYASTICQPQYSPTDSPHPIYSTQISTPPKWLPYTEGWHWSPSQTVHLPHHTMWEALASISGPSKCPHARGPALYTRVSAIVIPGPCIQSHWRPVLPSSKSRAVTAYRQACKEPTLHNSAPVAITARC